MDLVRQPLHILIDVDERFVEKTKYVFSHLCKVIGLKPLFYLRHAPAFTQVYYGPPTAGEYPVSIYHDPAAADFFAGNAAFPPDKVSFHRFREENVPFIFCERGEIFQLSPGTVSIRKDIIASAFYFLSCWQEYVDPTPRTPENRYDFRKSLQAFWGFTELPAVDRYADILETAVDQVFPEFGKRPRWLLQKDFAVTFTHDMDYWEFWTPGHYRSIQSYNRARLRHQPLHASYKLICHFLSKRLLRNSRRHHAGILHRDTIHDVRSTSFIITADKMADPRQAYFQDHQRELRALAEETDIGLHGSPTAAFDKSILATELKALADAGLETKRYRSHRLAFDYQLTFALLEELGFDYDCTLGFWEYSGFRAGSSYPFYPYCLAEDRPFRVLEIPLAVMDVSLFSSIAMNMRPTKAARFLERLIARTRSHHGHLSFLWHYNTFDWVDYPFWSSIWGEIIRHVKFRNAWICSTDELHEYWEKR
jgi:hypothetical protein